MTLSRTDNDPKSRTARRRGGRSRLRNPAGGPGLRTLIDRRNRLYKEAQKDPDSEAGVLVRTFLLSGMLAEAAGERGARPVDRRRTARLELLVAEQGERLDDIARIAQEGEEQQLDEMTIYNRIAEVVGLRVPSPQPAPPADRQPSSGDPREDTCQTQASQTLAPPAPTTK